MACVPGRPAHRSRRSNDGLCGRSHTRADSPISRCGGPGTDAHSHPRTNAGNHRPIRRPTHGNADACLRTDGGSRTDPDTGYPAHAQEDGSCPHGDGDPRSLRPSGR